MFQSKLASFIIRSILAGVLIGFGCTIYVVCENKYIGSFLFSLGLFSIIIKDYLLYTGRVGDWVIKDTHKLIFMFLLNAFGTAITAYLFTFTRLDLSAVQGLVQTKLNDSYTSIFILSLGCGAMMHLAVFNFKKALHPIYVIMPIMFFILCSFEHCVASSGFFAMAKADFNLDLVYRIFLMFVGNGLGSLIFTKVVKHTPPNLGFAGK